MNRFFVVLVAAFLLVLAFFVSSFFMYEEIPIQLTVSEVVGFNVGTDKLYFGSIPPHSFGDRMIHIREGRFLFGRVNLKVFCDVSDWFYVSDNNFYLLRNHVKDVNVRVMVPSNAPPGDYNCTLRVYFFVV